LDEDGRSGSVDCLLGASEDVAFVAFYVDLDQARRRKIVRSPVRVQAKDWNIDHPSLRRSWWGNQGVRPWMRVVEGQAGLAIVRGKAHAMHRHAAISIQIDVPAQATQGLRRRLERVGRLEVQ